MIHNFVLNIEHAEHFGECQRFVWELLKGHILTALSLCSDQLGLENCCLYNWCDSKVASCLQSGKAESLSLRKFSVSVLAAVIHCNLLSEHAADQLSLWGVHGGAGRAWGTPHTWVGACPWSPASATQRKHFWGVQENVKVEGQHWAQCSQYERAGHSSCL